VSTEREEWAKRVFLKSAERCKEEMSRMTLTPDYQVTTRYNDGRGAARVDKDGDLNVSFPRPPGSTSTSTALFGSKSDKDKPEEDDDFQDTEDPPVDHHEAWRFLLAGGVAGAVSRSVTAPFDRLKIYLITTDTPHVNPNAVGGLGNPTRVWSKAISNLWGAMGKIYVDGGGVRAFWVGNGLNVIKIFPVSCLSQCCRMTHLSAPDSA